LGIVVMSHCELASNGKIEGRVGAALHGGLSVGAALDSGGSPQILWAPQMPELTRVGPEVSTNARIEGNCRITTTTKLQVFDAAGPEATAEVYIKLDGSGNTTGGARSAHAKLSAGFQAQASGTLKPFGFTIAEIHTDPFQREFVLFDQDIAIP
jgi:hypothetical protein